MRGGTIAVIVLFSISLFANEPILIFLNVLRSISLTYAPSQPQPNTNHRKLRDELSHNLFLMLQECNKFREHQAREILIDTLELQLQRRTLGLELLKERIRSADDALEGLLKFREAS